MTETADRCPATNPYRYAWWVVPGERCTRPTGHDGPHTIPQRSQDGLLLANAQWFWWPEKTVAAGEPVSVPPGWTRGLGESQDWDNGDVAVSVPPPSKIDVRKRLTGKAVDYAKEYGHWRLEADAEIRKLNADEADLDIGCAGDALDSLRRTLDELWAAGVAEGRRQRDEETHADVRRSAEAALAAFGPAPESVTVSYTAATAHLMPAPRGYVCAAGCGHSIAVHREHGCDALGGQCECPAPHGRILPSSEASGDDRG